MEETFDGLFNRLLRLVLFLLFLLLVLVVMVLLLSTFLKVVIEFMGSALFFLLLFSLLALVILLGVALVTAALAEASSDILLDGVAELFSLFDTTGASSSSSNTRSSLAEFRVLRLFKLPSVTRGAGVSVSVAVVFAGVATTAAAAKAAAAAFVEAIACLTSREDSASEWLSCVSVCSRGSRSSIRRELFDPCPILVEEDGRGIEEVLLLLLLLFSFISTAVASSCFGNAALFLLMDELSMLLMILVSSLSFLLSLVV
mmetsp:Transcript_19532/g.28245  ORF Transcript_19532/g.28245 Transcript_19532/m.28245 type:complete len:258 (-) Transcript_19532:216-989(-)